MSSGETNPRAFVNIRQVGAKGREFWYARDLQEVLGYADFNTIDQAVLLASEACNAGGINVKQHIVPVKRLKEIDGIECHVKDYILSRFACYLAIKDDDAVQKIIGYGKAYYAQMTPEQEVSEEELGRLEAKKRLLLRPLVAESNKLLASSIEVGGAHVFKSLYDEGYRGLYDGLSAGELRNAMGLGSGKETFDYMCSEGLAANFAKTKLAVSEIQKTGIRRNLENICDIHYQAGSDVRRSINRVGATKPENLPVADKSISRLLKDVRTQEGGLI